MLRDELAAYGMDKLMGTTTVGDSEAKFLNIGFVPCYAENFLKSLSCENMCSQYMPDYITDQKIYARLHQSW